MYFIPVNLFSFPFFSLVNCNISDTHTHIHYCIYINYIYYFNNKHFVNGTWLNGHSAQLQTDDVNLKMKINWPV